MNTSIFKFFAITIITLVFIYAFSVSYTSDSVDNISYVIALAVDENKDSKEQNLKVTFEFMDTSSFASDKSSDSNNAIIDTVSASSINSAINLLNAYIGKAVNLAHCKVVVFSDEIAKNGVDSEVSELMNNIQVRPTTNIVICKGKAQEYIKNSSSELEKILTKYYDIFPNSSEYTGYTSNIQIGNFYNYLTTKECGNLAILGGLNPTLSNSNSSNSKENENSSNSSSENSSTNDISISKMVAGNAPILGERGTENIGLAVLKDGKYISDLTAVDTLCHTLISGEVNSFLLSMNNTELYEKYIDIDLFENTSPKIKVDISGDEPKIDIDIKLVGRISGIKNGIDYTDESSNLDLDKISEATNKALEGYIISYLNRTTQEFNCDIDYFYNYAKRHFLTIEDWKKYNWESKYLNSKFNVKVESKVYYSLLNSD